MTTKPDFTPAELRALWGAVAQYLDNSCGEECEGNPHEPAARSASAKLDLFVMGAALGAPVSTREIARVTSHDPCIMSGCTHEYGHEGAHEYLNSDYA